MNRNDRRIAQTALVVAVLALIGLWLTDGDQQTPVVQQSKDSTQQQGKGNYYGKGRYRQHTSAPMAVGDLPARHVEEFYFDPNSADSTQLLRLGLPAWMVRNIYRYRARGGVYRTKRDFARTYGLTKKDYQRLEPYIRISDDYQSAATLFPKEARDTMHYPVKLKEGERIVLNTTHRAEYRRHHPTDEGAWHRQLLCQGDCSSRQVDWWLRQCGPIGRNRRFPTVGQTVFRHQ